MSKTQHIVQFFLVIGILIFLNILGNVFYQYFDLTEDKRFSLTEPTKNLITNLDDVVTIEIFLEGDFPAGFKRLQASVKDLLSEFRSLSSNIEFQFINPNVGTTKEINAMRAGLKEAGIFPVNLFVQGAAGREELLIFPAAIVRYRNRAKPVQLLENDIPGADPELVLNNSIGLLEYKLANAIQKLQVIHKPFVAFLTGHGELNALETADLAKSLRQSYEVEPINLDSVIAINQKIKVLMVNRPRGTFPEKHKFIIDQYVMNGGKVIWLIDRLNVGLDSMQFNRSYVPVDYPLNIEDLLFRYGTRIEPNLVLDLECTKIPQIIGKVGGQPQIDYLEWFYHPAIMPTSSHPIVKNLDRINLLFPSSIDTIKTKTPVKKTILLTSSQKTRMQYPPVQLNFEILRYPPDPAKFNKPNQPVAVLLEGTFPSLYENRVAEEMAATLDSIGMPFKDVSKPTSMLVVTDGDIAKNLVNYKDGSYKPLGYNEFVRYQFANKDFLLNTVEYMLDDNGVIQARTKEVKLRLLDKTRMKTEALYWQVFNLALPLFLLMVFGVIWNFVRRRKYAN